MNILFLYLNAFSGSGGIETFNRAFMKASSEISAERGYRFEALSLHDLQGNNMYINNSSLTLFRKNRVRFTLSALSRGLSSDLVILGHLNLAPVGLLLKTLKKNLGVYVVAHGIDVWDGLSTMKKKFLHKADCILSVSSFTKHKMVQNHGLDPLKITVFPDTLDPYFNIPESFGKNAQVMAELGISITDRVMLTVSRLSSAEKYKGYDRVVEALPSILKVVPDLKYVIVGKGDRREIQRVEALARNLGVADRVILAGFVPNGDLTEYYTLADVFILPSRGEGFGIVFLEALVCGRPVITGNKDASVEAILDGQLGISVDPDDTEEIAEAVIGILRRAGDRDPADCYGLQSAALSHFGFEAFKNRLKEFINIHGG